VIDHGRVIAEGTSDQLKSRLGRTAVEVVLVDDDTAHRAAEALAGLNPEVEGPTVRVATDEGLATTSEVVRRLETTGLDVLSLQLRQPSLDEVFLTLTGSSPPIEEGAA